MIIRAIMLSDKDSFYELDRHHGFYNKEHVSIAGARVFQVMKSLNVF